MNLEKKNKEKRKVTPLTKSERLIFFFYPFSRDSGFLNTHEFNKKEDERFEKFGFELKIKQASEVRQRGIIFYAVIVFIIIIVSSVTR
jgi:hypothetical protein